MCCSFRWDLFRISQNLNTLGVFWMNQVQMGQNAVGRMAGAIRSG